MKPKKPARWLDRELMTCRHTLSLATSEKEFHATLMAFGVPPLTWPIEWCSPRGAATSFAEVGGARLALVTIDPWSADGKSCADPIQIAALLCHEAVHIFQEDCRLIGEKTPSDEFQAYSIQSLTQNLLYAYAERIA